MYKLLALDLDGTVLNADHNISPILKAKIQELKDKFHIMIVTGRHHTAARPYYAELELSTPAICCNGTYLYDFKNETVIQHNAISKDNAQKFIALAEQHNMKLVMYATDSMCFSNRNPVEYIEEMATWAEGFPLATKPSIKPINSFSKEAAETDYVWKFVIEGDQVDAFTAIPFISDNFTAERSWHNRSDFSNKGNQKGVALKNYAEKLGIPASQIVAIGDNHNDISMLEYAGMGVAMAQADDLVKQASQKTTHSSNDNEHALADMITELFN